ncbi:MAG: 16S rRNA (guanine(527)-N(7))-methyltransferase RsmG [Planctomycetota bacterium]
MTASEELKAALEKHSIELPEGSIDRLRQYSEVMWKINESLNLTRHTTFDLFVGRDIRDCVQLANVIEAGEEVLDLGSGNGIPGIPLAILRPDIEVSLAESVAKRATALNQIVSDLELPVAVYGARGEDLFEDFRFTSVVSRAVASITKFCRWLEPHWSGVGRLLLVKGPRWIDERGEARHQGVMQGLAMRKVAEYSLGDDEEAQGVILQIQPKAREE